MQHTQRAIWNGLQECLPDVFRMTKPKGDHALSAVCELWTHPFGFELRLQIDGHGLQMTTVLRSAPEVVKTVEAWRAAMLAKGWT